MNDVKEQAKKYYLEGMKQKDIAEKCAISLNTLKSWITRGKWAQEKNAPQKNKGAPKGNTNAVGHGAPVGNTNALGNDGGAPVGNKNAVTTGEYETIFFDSMSKEDQELYKSINNDPLARANEEIRLLTFRQNKMMSRIQNAENGLNESEVQTLQELRGRKQIVNEAGGKTVVIEVPELVTTEIKQRTSKRIDNVLKIEEALTRISNQLARAIKLRDDLEQSSTKEALMLAQIKKAEAEARILENKADKLTSDGQVDELLNALVNPIVSQSADGDSDD